MEPHAPTVPEIPPPPPPLCSPSLSSPDHRDSVSSLNLDSASSSDLSSQGNSSDTDINSITSRPTVARHATYNGSSLSLSIETSPNKLSTISARTGGQLRRVASAGHNRSISSPMGFTGEKGVATPQRGAAALFGSLFSKPAEQHPGVASTATTTPSLLPAQMSKERSGSALSTTTPKSSSKGFFTTLGTAIQTQLSNASPPASPSRRPTRNHLLEPDSTLLVDEFAGISFRQLINSYTLEPTDPPESPEEAQKNTPEGRLEELSVTAADLLERVYTAYQSRTSSLAGLLSSHADTAELLEESRSRTSQYKLQLERLATDEQEARDEQNFRITVQERRIKQLETALHTECTKREEAEEELRRTADRERKKRTSAASDSGFESDGDSLFSRDRASMVVSPVESFMDGADEQNGGGARRDSLTPSTYTISSSRCESCSHCTTASSSVRSLTPSSASIRNPTPLSQAWSPDSDGSGEKTPTQTPVSSPPSATAPTTKWGFGSLTRKAGAAVAWSGGNVEEVRSENRVLRARVGELERVVDDCLEFVAGRERVVVFRGT